MLGDAGTGKSSFVRCACFGESHSGSFHWQPEGQSLRVTTDLGEFVFELVMKTQADLIAEPSLVEKSQGALIIFDLTKKETYKHAKQSQRELQKRLRKGRAYPIVSVGNKVDLAAKVPERSRSRLRKQGNYVEISAREGFKIGRPFLILTRLLTGQTPSSFSISSALEPRAPLCITSSFESLPKEQCTERVWREALDMLSSECRRSAEMLLASGDPILKTALETAQASNDAQELAETVALRIGISR